MLAITVTKADWDLARQITNGMQPDSYQYSCNCPVARAFKRTYPDGNIEWVHTSGLTYEGQGYNVHKDYALAMETIVNSFDWKDYLLWSDQGIYLEFTAKQ